MKLIRDNWTRRTISMDFLLSHTLLVVGNILKNVPSFPSIHHIITTHCQPHHLTSILFLPPPSSLTLTHPIPSLPNPPTLSHSSASHLLPPTIKPLSLTLIHLYPQYQTAPNLPPSSPPLPTTKFLTLSPTHQSYSHHDTPKPYFPLLENNQIRM